MPITQIEWQSSTEEIRIAPEKEALGVTSKTKTSDKAHHPRIDASRSFAKKDGKLYRLRTHRNVYVDSQKEPTPWTFEWVELLTVNDGAEVATRWPNGNWELHLEYTDSELRPPVYAKFKLWTLWYNPLIHGPPN